MKSKQWRGVFRLVWMTAIALAICLGFMMNDAKAPVEDETAARQETPPPAASAAENAERVEKACQVIQTMDFSRCGHSVTRRITVPEALVSVGFSEVQAYYDLWRVESFSGTYISMRREIPLFCPMHVVLGVNEAGETVLCRNVYGDGMAVVKTCGDPLTAFSEEDQETLLLGLGFDSEEDAETWLRERKNP